jgi:hypothetical protein
VTFHLDHPRLQALGKQKPPPHFHPFQEEYFTMLEGEMALEIEGKAGLLRPEDGEFCVKRWTNHRIYPPASAFEEGGPKKAVCLASGEQSFYNFQLDFLFFENWYAYQDLVVMKGAKPDLIQIMCVSAAACRHPHSARRGTFPPAYAYHPEHTQLWDAGDSYLSPPSWLPFGRYISLGVSILLGRYVGALLGYQPYFRHWSTDWSLACERMEKNIFQRRFAVRAKKAE